MQINTLLLIFFSISTIFNLLLCFFIFGLIYYLFPILKDFREVVRKAKETSENTLNTINKVQDDIGGETRAVVKGMGRIMQSFLPKEKK